MTAEDYAISFSCLFGAVARVSAPRVDYKAEGEILVEFSDGSLLRADYWRVLEEGREVVSSFDHQQQYGLLAPIDAVQRLDELLGQHAITHISVERGTGDLFLTFSFNIQLRVFGFTGYEAWEMRLSNGTVDYSNYVK